MKTKIHALGLLASVAIATFSHAQTDNRNFLYVSDHNLATNGQSGIVRVDKRTGEQVLITQGQYLADNDVFGLVAESPTTLLVLDVGMGSGQKIVRVNVTTMQQELVLQSGALESPVFASLGPDGYLYVSNNGWMGAPGSIIRVNLSSGAYEPIVLGGRPGQSVFHPNGYLYFVRTNDGSSEQGVFRVDVGSRQVTRVSPRGLIVGGGQLAVDTDGSLLMADYGTSASGDSKIIRIDPNNGHQTLFSPATGPNQLRANQLTGLWVDSAGDIYALDTGNPGGQAAVYKVDRATGHLTVVSPQSGQTQLMWNTCSLAELPLAPDPCAELRAQLEQANATIAALNAQVAQLTMDNTDLRQQLTAANSLNSHLAADKLLLQQQLATAGTQLAQLQADKAALQQSLASANAQIAQLTAEKTALQQQLAAANATIDTLHTQVAQLTAANAALQQQLTAATTALAATDSALGRLEADFRREFSDAGFVVPGGSTAARVQALVDAVIALNHGRKQGVYTGLK
jgi:DNA-binding beta-propeller fold protein YncE